MRRPGRSNRRTLAYKGGGGGSGPPPEPTGTLQAVSEAATGSFAGTVASGLATPTFDFDTSKNVTLSTTMRASGPTPPVVLLAAGTGSLTFATGCPGFWVDILAGALTFDLSFDNGATVAFSAQTIPVGGGNYTIPSGTYAGMIITFPLGTYNADNLYEGAVADLTSPEGFSLASVTTAAQPVYRVATGGEAPYLLGAGAQYLRCTDAAVVAVLTNDPAFTVFHRVAYTVADASNSVYSCGRNNAFGKRRFGIATTVGGRQSHTHSNDDNSVNGTETSSADDSSTSAHSVAWYGPGSGGALNCSINDAAADPSVATTIGTLTATRFSVMAEDDNAAGVFLSGKLYRVVGFNSQLSASQRTAWFAEI